jgi:hypothetical protein
MAAALARPGTAANPIVRTRTRRVVEKVRVGARSAAKAAAEEKHTIAAAVTGGLLGYAKRQNIAIPRLGPLSTNATAALALFIAGRVTKSRMIRHAATGAIAITMYEFASEGFGGTAPSTTSGEI